LNIDITVLAVKNNLNLGYYSKYCHHRVLIDELDEDLLLNKLRELAARSTEKYVLYFDNDYMVSMLTKHADLLEEEFLTTQELHKLTFKEKQLEEVKKAGIPYPGTWKFPTWEAIELADIKKNRKLIAKPSQGAGKKPFKTLIIENKDKIKQTLSKYVDSPKDIIIQELITGYEEEGDKADIWVALAYRAFNSNNITVVTAIKYTMYPKTGGVMAIGKPVKSHRIEELTRKFMDSTDYKGILGIEFKYSVEDDDYYFIEVSPRTEGFHNLTCLCGVDLPKIAYIDRTGSEIEPAIEVEYPSEAYWINFRYILDSFITEKKIYGISKTLKAYFAKKKAWQIYDPRDRAPGKRNMMFIIKRLSLKFKKIFRKMK
jgi:predicted ATP-grasp superfamily ATP-dependent carboligase